MAAALQTRIPSSSLTPSFANLPTLLAMKTSWMATMTALLCSLTHGLRQGNPDGQVPQLPDMPAVPDLAIPGEPNPEQEMGANLDKVMGAAEILGKVMKGCNEVAMLEEIGSADDLWVTFLVLGVIGLIDACIFLPNFVPVSPAVSKLMGGVAILTGILCLIIPAIAGALIHGAIKNHCEIFASSITTYNGAGQCYSSKKGIISIAVGLLDCILGTVLILRTITKETEAKAPVEATSG